MDLRWTSDGPQEAELCRAGGVVHVFVFTNKTYLHNVTPTIEFSEPSLPAGIIYEMVGQFKYSRANYSFSLLH